MYVDNSCRCTATSGSAGSPVQFACVLPLNTRCYNRVFNSSQSAVSVATEYFTINTLINEQATQSSHFSYKIGVAYLPAHVPFTLVTGKMYKPARSLGQVPLRPSKHQLLNINQPGLNQARSASGGLAISFCLGPVCPLPGTCYVCACSQPTEL